MIRLAICDDQELFRVGLSQLIETYEDFHIVHSCPNGVHLIDCLEIVMVDAVLLDVRMTPMDGVECCTILREKYPTLPILMLTTFDNDDLVFDALRAGASGYLLKDCSADELFSSISSILSGSNIFSAEITKKIFAKNSDELFVNKMSSGTAGSSSSALSIQRVKYPLTRREVEIVRLISQGMSNKEIGNRLFLAHGTVKNHVTNILTKLDAKDRAQAVSIAIGTGLI